MLGKVITSVTSLRKRNSFGRIDIRFAQPISLREATEDFIRREHRERFEAARLERIASGEGARVVEEEAVYHGMDEAELLTQHRELAASFLAGENFALVDELADRVVRGMMKESMVMPTALVASIILKNRREGKASFQGVT